MDFIQEVYGDDQKAVDISYSNYREIIGCSDFMA
jgi:hypothetical protein